MSRQNLYLIYDLGVSNDLQSTDKCFTYLIILFNTHNSSMGRITLTHFLDKTTELQEGIVLVSDRAQI